MGRGGERKELSLLGGGPRASVLEDSVSSTLLEIREGRGLAFI